jgi:hypothetical protein
MKRSKIENEEGKRRANITVVIVYVPDGLQLPPVQLASRQVGTYTAYDISTLIREPLVHPIHCFVVCLDSRCSIVHGICTICSRC